MKDKITVELSRNELKQMCCCCATTKCPMSDKNLVNCNLILAKKFKVIQTKENRR